MKDYSALRGSDLESELQDLIDNKSILTIEYTGVFRDVYPLEIKAGKLWVYQKGDSYEKSSGLRQMFLNKIVLWDVLKEGVNIEDWKQELTDLEQEIAKAKAKVPA